MTIESQLQTLPATTIWLLHFKLCDLTLNWYKMQFYQFMILDKDGKVV